MKLLQLNATANWGSTGKIAEGIGIEAMNRGWESTIAFGRSFNTSKSHLIKVGSPKDVYLHYARHLFLDGDGHGSSNATKALVEKIKNLAPDIIHLHNIHDYWLNYPLLFDYFATINTPIIWTFHDCWAFTGSCKYFDLIDCKKWKERCENCEMRYFGLDRSTQKYNLKKDLISKFASRLVIVPVSHWLEDLCRNSFLKDMDIQLIHNGIDTNIFKPCSKKAAKPLILSVALPWSKRKGFEDILQLRELLPIEKVDIAMIGLSKKQLKALPKSIIGIERTQNVNELVQWYNKAWAYVNPSHSDNFPTVNLEALACGTPVITYRTGGSPEAVDNKTGIIVEKGDIKGLSNAVMSVINAPERYSIESCRERAVECFNKDKQFAKYVNLYENLLEKDNL